MRQEYSKEQMESISILYENVAWECELEWEYCSTWSFYWFNVLDLTADLLFQRQLLQEVQKLATLFACGDYLFYSYKQFSKTNFGGLECEMNISGTFCSALRCRLLRCVIRISDHLLWNSLQWIKISARKWIRFH